MGPTGCTETSLINYHCSLPNKHRRTQFPATSRRKPEITHFKEQILPHREQPAAITNTSQSEQPAAITNTSQSEQPAAITNSSQSEQPTAITNTSQSEQPAAITNSSQSEQPAAITNTSRLMMFQLNFH
jgi:hypothetical protein